MNKNVLNTFINKYYLNGSAGTVKWIVADSLLKTTSTYANKNGIAFVAMKDEIDLPDSEIGINDTPKLQKLLGVLNQNIKLSYNHRPSSDVILSVDIESDDLSVRYVTADLTTVPPPPIKKTTPPFNFEFKLTHDFMYKFIKAKSALNDVTTFTILKNESGVGRVTFVIGYNKDINSNRITLDVDPIPGKDRLGTDIPFSAVYLKEVFTSNLDCEDAVLKISDAGLAHIEFDTDMFNCNYYLINQPKQPE